MSLRSFAHEVGKSVFAATLTGIGLQVGRDVYVWGKAKFSGKPEQPPLVRIANDGIDTPVPGTPRCCNKR